MNEAISMKNKNKGIERKLKKLFLKHKIVIELIDKAFWLNSEKREAIKMMVNVFMDFAQELANKKGVK